MITAVEGFPAITLKYDGVKKQASPQQFVTAKKPVLLLKLRN